MTVTETSAKALTHAHRDTCFDLTRLLEPSGKPQEGQKEEGQRWKGCWCRRRGLGTSSHRFRNRYKNPSHSKHPNIYPSKSNCTIMVAYFWVERTISLVSRESVRDVILKALLAGSFGKCAAKSAAWNMPPSLVHKEHHKKLRLDSRHPGHKPLVLAALATITTCSFQSAVWGGRCASYRINGHLEESVLQRKKYVG